MAEQDLVVDTLLQLQTSRDASAAASPPAARRSPPRGSRDGPPPAASADVPVPSAPVPGGRAAPRASRACKECRVRKARCDSKQPRCGGCARRGVECDYVDDDGRRAGPRKRVAALEARLAELEKRKVPPEPASTAGEPPLPPSLSLPGFGHSPQFDSQSLTLPVPPPLPVSAPEQAVPPAHSYVPASVPAPPPVLRPASDSASPKGLVQLPSLPSPALPDASAVAQSIQRDLDSADGTRTPAVGGRSLTSQIADVKGVLSVADGGHLRWFGATSSRHLSFGALALDHFQSVPPPVLQQRCATALQREGYKFVDDERLELRLIDHYFAWHNPFFYIVSPDLFRAHRQACLRGAAEHKFFSWALYFAILAYAADLHHPGTEAHTPSGVLYMKKARICLEEELDSPQETTVQALAIMAAHEVYSGRDARGWMYVSMASSSALDLGLHMDSAAAVESGRMSIVDYHARNTVWWGVYVYASLWGLYVGRPSLVHAVEITCPHPSAAQQGSSFFGHLVSLTRITNSVIVELYSTLPSSIDLRTPSSAADAAHERLLTWYNELPVEFTLDLELNPAPPAQVILLHLQSYVVVLLVHRPFLAHGILSRGFELCCAATSSMAYLLDVYRRLFGFRRISVVAVHQIFTAATTLVYIIYATDEAREKGRAVPAAANNARGNLVICLAALSAFASKQMHARRSYLSVVVLMKRWRVTLNERASDDPSLGLPPLSQVTHAAATLGRSDAPQAEQYQSLSRTLYELSQQPPDGGLGAPHAGFVDDGPSTTPFRSLELELERFLADSGRSTAAASDLTGSGEPVAGGSSNFNFGLPSATATAAAGLPSLEVETPPGFARTTGFSDFLNTVSNSDDLFPGAAWDGPSLADLFDFGQVGDTSAAPPL